MAGNRVEELEAKVRELEATVDGLTDELVETKERLRLIEEKAGPELDDIVEGRSSRRQARDTMDDGRAQQTEQQRQQQAEAAEPAEPADGGEPAADDDKSTEAEGEDESSEASDDIIVA